MAEPRRKGCYSRRIGSEELLLLFKPVSVTSVCCGAAAFELAKNEEMIEYFRNCNVSNVWHDGTSVGALSVQCVTRGSQKLIQWRMTALDSRVKRLQRLKPLWMPLLFKQCCGFLVAVGSESPWLQWLLPCQWWERLRWQRLLWQLCNLKTATPSLSTIKQNVAVLADMIQVVAMAEVSQLLLAVAAVWMWLHHHHQQEQWQCHQSKRL